MKFINKKNKTFWILSFLFLLSLVLNISYLLYWSGIGLEGDLSFNDEFAYKELAENIIDTNTYGYGNTPETTYTAGYPLFLSIFYFLFNNVIQVGRIINVIVVALFVILVYKIAKIFLTKRISLIAAIITALFPTFKLYIPYLLNHLFYTFLLLCAYYLFLRYLKERRILIIIFCSFFLGIMILVRIETILLIFMILFVILLNNINKTRTKNNILAIFILVFVSFLIVLPLSIRNYNLIGVFAPSDLLSGPLDLWATIYGSFYQSNKMTVHEFKNLHFANLNVNDKKSLAKKEVMYLLITHPEYYAEGVLRNTLYWLFGYHNYLNPYIVKVGLFEALNNEQYSVVFWKIFLFLFQEIIIFSGIFGFIILFFQNKKTFLIYSLPLISGFLVYSFIWGEPRFQVHILPFLTIFSVYTFINLIATVKKTPVYDEYKSIEL